jgi:hypothetical protein
MRYYTRRRREPEDWRFYWEDPSDWDNAVVVVATEDDGLTIAVAEEKAMDSYNETFECSICLPKAEAIRLRDLLNEHLPPNC